jgi:hypothetical protein
VALIVHVLACLAEGLGIRATARVFAVDATTVLRWLVDAAAPLQVFARSFLGDVPVEQVQLDEVDAVLRDSSTAYRNCPASVAGECFLCAKALRRSKPLRDFCPAVPGGCEPRRRGHPAPGGVARLGLDSQGSPR